MTIRVTRLPDVGEGVAEAELVAWHVAVGDTVTSDTVVAEVLTDKATVEIYSPVHGTVVALHGTAGEVLAVGSDFIAIETAEEASPQEGAPVTAAPPPTVLAPEPPEPAVTDASEPAVTDASVAAQIATAARPLAAPAVRARARSLGIELEGIVGTGPDRHITHEDLDRHRGAPNLPGSERPRETTQVPYIGLRRKIGVQVAASAARIPHITYVDEVDVTQLEQLRATLAAEHPQQPRVTVLPFVVRAIVMAVSDQPVLNSTFDDHAEMITTHGAVHVGIATQTPNGLIVPVVRDAQGLDLWHVAAELSRVTGAARDGTASREELSGSTISITSLGALGGLVTTPIINHPEVAIVGINKMQVRPVWDGTAFAPRTMMNLSCSFDHRIIDGWVAASFVQRIKALLEAPALLFVPAPQD